MVHGNRETPDSIYSWNFPIQHPSGVQGISHEFPPIPRSNQFNSQMHVTFK